MISMHGFEVIKELGSILSGDELIIASNGNISRQIYHYLPRPQIYLRGSMGLAIPVGLGAAISNPKRKVLVILGDGNLLMGLGALVTISFVKPKNMKILILDNNEYATTGHQRTTSNVLDYSSLLNGFGISYIEVIQRDETTQAIHKKIRQLLDASNLCVLPTLVTSDPPVLSNIPWHPEKITEMLKQ